MFLFWKSVDNVRIWKWFRFVKCSSLTWFRFQDCSYLKNVHFLKQKILISKLVKFWKCLFFEFWFQYFHITKCSFLKMVQKIFKYSNFELLRDNTMKSCEQRDGSGAGRRRCSDDGGVNCSERLRHMLENTRIMRSVNVFKPKIQDYLVYGHRIKKWQHESCMKRWD